MLFYNEYNAEGLGRKSDEVYAMVKGMRARGIPIHGVGLQMHIDYLKYPTPADVTSNINRLAALGVQVHVTELDVRIEMPVTPEKLAKQAETYAAIVNASMAGSNCTAILTWGVTDKHSWVPSYFKNCGAALLFDAAGKRKPACAAVQRCLQAHAAELKHKE